MCNENVRTLRSELYILSLTFLWRATFHICRLSTFAPDCTHGFSTYSKYLLKKLTTVECHQYLQVARCLCSLTDFFREAELLFSNFKSRKSTYKPDTRSLGSSGRFLWWSHPRWQHMGCSYHVTRLLVCLLVT